jgi:hypothetical protein
MGDATCMQLKSQMKQFLKETLTYIEKLLKVEGEPSSRIQAMLFIIAVLIDCVLAILVFLP